MNYDKYTYSKGEWVKYGTIGTVATMMLIYLFYDSLFIMVILGIPGGILFAIYYKKQCIRQRKWALTLQFKECMETMVTALNAGYSMENSIEEARRDLSHIYEEDDLIMKELTYIKGGMQMGNSIAYLLSDLGNRSGCEEIQTFAEIYEIARRSGGNLMSVMRQTSTNIRDKIELNREIETMISGKKLESIFMSVVPLGIILFLRICSPGFLDPLYHNLVGILIMTGALGLYGLSFAWSRKIMNISWK